MNDKDIDPTNIDSLKIENLDEIVSKKPVYSGWYAILTGSRREEKVCKWLDARLKRAGGTGLTGKLIPYTRQEIMEEGTPVIKIKNLSLVYVKADPELMAQVLYAPDPADMRERRENGIRKSFEIRDIDAYRSMSRSGAAVCQYKVGDKVVEKATGSEYQVMDIDNESITISMTLFNQPFSKIVTPDEIVYKNDRSW